MSSRFDGKLDCLCHSVAYASAAAMKKPFLETTPEAFAEAHLISAYSLIALCRSARPLMEAAGGGSVVAMSYLGSQRVGACACCSRVTRSGWCMTQGLWLVWCAGHPQLQGDECCQGILGELRKSTSC